MKDRKILCFSHNNLTLRTIFYIIDFALVEVILLKWNLQWLLKQNNGEFSFSDELVFPKEAFLKFNNLLDLKNVYVQGNGRLVIKDQRLYIDMKITGMMVLPCALTLEEVDYPFEIESTEVFSFDKPSPDEDVHEVKKNIVDITPIIFQNIMAEVPLRVVKEGAKVKTEGEGWRIISTKEEVTDQEIIDPRLAKLKNYFKDKN